MEEHWKNKRLPGFPFSPICVNVDMGRILEKKTFQEEDPGIKSTAKPEDCDHRLSSLKIVKEEKMKALSVKNPYATQILRGEKPIEYRSWKTDWRGDILIVSSASPKIDGMLAGHALCIVRLDDIVPSRTCPGQFDWILKDVRPVEPFPVRGKLYLYEVDDALIHPTGETVTQVSVPKTPIRRQQRVREQKVLVKASEPIPVDPWGKASPIFYLHEKKCRASGYIANNGDFLLREKSVICTRISPKFPDDLTAFREYCLVRGYIEDYRLIESLTFPTPSTAASFVLGRRVKGGKAWKTRNGETLTDWLDSKKKS